ncbi:alpha/beta fold hydrolase [Streptomyces sp. NPDC002533]
MHTRFPAPCTQTLVVQADDGVHLHVEVDGDPAQELTIVFVTGINTTVVYWGRQRRALADLARLVVFDHRGHGRSQDSPTARATIDQIARDTASVIEATAPSGPVIVVAHSMGAVAAPSLAQQRRDLFGTRIVGVVLMDTAAGHWMQISTGLPRFLSRPVIRVLGSTVPRLAKALGKPVAPATARTDRPTTAKRQGPATRSRLRTRLNRIRRITTVPSAAILALLTDLATCDYSHALPDLGAVPVLVLAGEDDRFLPLQYKAQTASAIPGAQFEVIAGAGHLSSIDEPEQTERHLRAFIQQVQATPTPAQPDSPSPATRTGRAW